MSDDLVTLTVTSNGIEAGMIVNMLELEGIKSMSQAIYGLTTIKGGMSDRQTILVKPEDLEAAREILAAADLP